MTNLDKAEPTDSKDPSRITSTNFLDGDEVTFKYIYKLLYTYIQRFRLASDIVEDIIMSTIYKSYTTIKKDNLYFDSNQLKVYLLEQVSTLASIYSSRYTEDRILPSRPIIKEENKVDEVERLKEIILALPDTYRVIINLTYIEGYTIKEAAEKMNISESKASSLRARAIESLRTAYTSGKI